MSAHVRCLRVGSLVAWLLAACADEGEVLPNLPMCAPLERRDCPCLGRGTGSQTCNAQGTGYGACTGCPSEPDPEPNEGDPEAGPPEPPGRPDSGSEGPDDAEAERPHDASEPTQEGAAEGVSCGVGLPTQCALGSQKCCVRSLETDTCIDASETCACERQGADCQTMEATCDGPEDCQAGQVCCGTLAGGTRYSGFVCAASCDQNGNQRTACHQDNAACPGGTICANSQLLTNLQVCIDPASIEQ